MRTLFKALLAATALIPAAAHAQDRPERGGGWRGDRGGAAAKIEVRDAERGFEARAPRPRALPQVAPQAAQRNVPEPGGRWNRDRTDGDRQVRPDRDNSPGLQPRAEQRRWNADNSDRRAFGDRGRDGRDRDRPRLDPGRGDGRPDRTGSPGQQVDRRPDNRQQWNQPRRDGRFDGRTDRQRFGWDDRFDGRDSWNRDWRNDRRYDWNGYRATNRGAYRLPRYYAPSGWSYGYRRFGIGATLSSLLWAQNYWIEDPFTYRLPQVWGPYRWVRYYDDAMLVDVRTGRVVDVVYDIFW